MRYFGTLLLTLALAAPVCAASENPAPDAGAPRAQKGEKASKGGFHGPISGAKADTVAKALELTNDAPVALTGSLVSKEAAAKDLYIFKDASGEVKVKIERKVFAGNDVTPENTIRISGRVDKEDGKDVEINVKTLEMIK